MSLQETGPIYDGRFESKPTIHGDTMSWYDVLSSRPDRLQQFHALEPLAQQLIEDRLLLQQRLRVVEGLLQQQTAHFKALVMENIRHSPAVINLDTEDDNEQIPISNDLLKKAYVDQARAYQDCVEATTAVMDVEGRLCAMGVPSAPYLEMMNFNLTGQALED